MELPPYRLPTRKAILLQMWRRSAQYLKKIGGVILIASIIFWALSYFPLNPRLDKDYTKAASDSVMHYSSLAKSISLNDTLGFRKLMSDKDRALHKLELEERSEKRERRGANAAGQGFRGRSSRFSSSPNGGGKAAATASSTIRAGSPPTARTTSTSSTQTITVSRSSPAPAYSSAHGAPKAPGTGSSGLHGSSRSVPTTASTSPI